MDHQINITKKVTGEFVGSFHYSGNDCSQKALKASLKAHWMFKQVDLSEVDLATDVYYLNDFIGNKKAFKRVPAKD